MPYFGIKFHLWGLERIVRRNIYINVENSAFITSVFLFLVKKNVSKMILSNKKSNQIIYQILISALLQNNLNSLLTGPNTLPFQCLRSSPTTLASTTYSPLAYNDKHKVRFQIRPKFQSCKSQF